MMIRQQITAKNPATNENERKETNEFKQKQIKNFDEFNDEERKIKEKPKNVFLRNDCTLKNPKQKNFN